MKILEDEAVKTLINTNTFNEVLHGKELIRKYIFDMKNIDIEKVKEPVNYIQVTMYKHAVKTALKYYKNKFKFKSK